MSKRWLVVMSAMAQLACCIARGSKVKTPRGERRIEELAVDDEVVVVDPSTLEEHVGKISAVRSAKRECSLINSLRLTSAHPLFDTDKNEWAPAGDWILGSRAHFATIEGPAKVVNSERFIGIDEVFDLSIDHPLHTYVVDGVIVHNKEPITGPRCQTADGVGVFSGDSCSCPIGTGTVDCSGTVGACSCASAPPPASTTVLLSRWSASDGDDENDLRDNGTWARLTCGPSPRSLTVVPGADVNWFRADGALAFRNFGDCFLEAELQVPETGSTWGHLWFLDRGQATASRRIVRVDDNVLFAIHDARVWFEPVGAPPFSSWNLAGNWQRYEWQLELLSPTTYRYWPRFRLGNGTVKGADTFVSPDGGTLANWYDAGNVFTFSSDAGTRVISVGHQSNGTSGGTVLHVADFALSNAGWIGPQSE